MAAFNGVVQNHDKGGAADDGSEVIARWRQGTGGGSAQQAQAHAEGGAGGNRRRMLRAQPDL